MKPVRGPSWLAKRAGRLAVVLTVFSVFGVLLWGGNEMALSAVARSGLGWFFERNGMEFRAESVRWGLAGPLVLEGLEIRERGGSAFGSVVYARRVEVARHSWREILFEGKPVCSGIEIVRSHVFADLRKRGDLLDREGGAVRVVPMGALFGMIFSKQLGIPEQISCLESTVDVLTDTSRLVFEGVTLSLEEGSAGTFVCKYPAITVGSFYRAFKPWTADAAGNGKKLPVAGLVMLPGVVLSRLDVRLTKIPEVSVSVRAQMFGGALRGDIDLREVVTGRIWDVAVVGSEIGLEGLAREMGWSPEGASGRLSEARLTFRGAVGRPTDAEASLRILARDFKWNNRRCATLDLGASLIQRRLVVSKFDFEQPGNKISTNGEISLAEGWAKIAEAPFLVNLRARIEDPDALGGVLGTGLNGIRGMVDIRGSVSGRPGTMDGFLGVHGTGLSYRSATADRVDLEVVFAKKKVEIVRCEMDGVGGGVRLGGEWELAYPHVYSAWLTAELQDVSKYVDVLKDAEGAFFSSGSLKIDWKSEGDLERPSGVFELEVADFVSRWTPTGVTGMCNADYSPSRMRFETLMLESGDLLFQANGVFSAGGFELEDVLLTAKGKPLLKGGGFLPVDLVALRRGDGWTQVVHRDQPIRLSIRTPGQVELQELMRLTGQVYPLSGQLSMDLTCEGLPEKLDGAARFSVSSMRYGPKGTPPAEVELRAELKAGALECEGHMVAKGMEKVDVVWSVSPFLFQPGTSRERVIDPTASLAGRLVFRRADFSLVEPLFPQLERLKGTLSGELEFSNTLGAPGIRGEAAVADASFSHRLPVPPVEGMGGRVAVSDGVVRIEEATGRAGGGSFHLSGEARFSKPWNLDYELEWAVDSVPLVLGSGLSVPVSGVIKAQGGSEGGALTGRLDLGPAMLGKGIRVEPLLSAKGWKLPHWTRPFEALAGLAPYGNWSLGVSLGEGGALRVGSDPLACQVVPRLFLGGSAVRPELTGTIGFQGMRVDAPGGVLFAEEGMFHLLPGSPRDPFMLIEATGNFSGIPVKAVAWGPLGEAKWILETPGGGFPQQGFWLVRNGMGPVVRAIEGLPPVDVWFAPNKQLVAQPVSMRVGDDTAWCGGIAFSESLNFQPGAAALPEQGYQPGFEWSIRTGP